MQPLIIVLLIALLVALTKLRESKKYYSALEKVLLESNKISEHWRAKFEAATLRANSISLDNVFLKAELKRKHRRVPKL